MTLLVLVRHATSQPPTPGAPDDYRRPLSDAGREQAVELVDQLVALAPTAIVCSPYLRAVQTVAPTAQRLQLAVGIDEGLTEWRMSAVPTPPGEYERRVSDAWQESELNLDGGESLAACDARVAATLDRLRLRAGRDGVLVVGGHGTWIARALRRYDARIDLDFWRGMPMPAVYSLAWSVKSPGPSITGPGL